VCGLTLLAVMSGQTLHYGSEAQLQHLYIKILPLQLSNTAPPFYFYSGCKGKLYMGLCFVKGVLLIFGF